jgi:hypothetical protein
LTVVDVVPDLGWVDGGSLDLWPIPDGGTALVGVPEVLCAAAAAINPATRIAARPGMLNFMR